MIVTAGIAILAVPLILVSGCDGDDGGMFIDCYAGGSSCQCFVGSEPPDGTYGCGPVGSDPVRCCADSGWPNSGDCGCELGYGCTLDEYGCTCGPLERTYPKAGGTLVDECDSDEVYGALPETHCCKNWGELGEDYCRCGGLDCAAGETEVDSCSARASADAVECDSGQTEVDSCADGENPPDDNGGGSSGPSGSATSVGVGTGGGSCDLKPEVYFRECGGGCGDVMHCVQFCASCDAYCQVPCEEDADCTAVGAGVCKYPESSGGSAVCTKAPSKCP